MQPFSYQPATSTAQASQVLAAQKNAMAIAGGTNLVDLMKLGVLTPSRLIDLQDLPLQQITATQEGLRLGALVTNFAAANHAEVKKTYPLLAAAILSGASPQIRNVATIGGNLLQRTRCPYFQDLAEACNKRHPGSGCSAIGGITRSHAILGVSSACIATHPSDMAVAMIALDATLHLTGADGERSLPLRKFYLEPGTTPDRENGLRPGELVVAVSLKAPPPASRSAYVKIRDRASFEFALVSAAVSARLDGGKIAAVAVALGGVGTRPWHAPEAEAVLLGATPSRELFASAASKVLAAAKPQPGNAFKVELAKRAIVTALQQVCLRQGA